MKRACLMLVMSLLPACGTEKPVGELKYVHSSSGRLVVSLAQEHQGAASYCVWWVYREGQELLTPDGGMTRGELNSAMSFPDFHYYLGMAVTAFAFAGGVSLVVAGLMGEIDEGVLAAIVPLGLAAALYHDTVAREKFAQEYRASKMISDKEALVLSGKDFRKIIDRIKKKNKKYRRVGTCDQSLELD